MADFLSGKEPADIKGLGYKSKDGKFLINSIPNFLDLNKIPIPFFGHGKWLHFARPKNDPAQK